MTKRWLAALAGGVLVVTSGCGTTKTNDDIKTPDDTTPVDQGPTDQPKPTENPVPEVISLQAKSGTRLKAQWTQPGEGLQNLFEGFFDAQLGAECSFEVAVDGQMRCVPRFNGGSLFVVYLDDACTQPIALNFTEDCGQTPKYAVVDSTAQGECPTTSAAQVFQLGAAVSPPSSIYYPGSGGCGEIPVDQLGAVELFEMNTEVDLATLVTGTVEKVELAQGLQAGFMAGSDGSKMLQSFFTQSPTDPNTQIGCGFYPGADSKWRCMPTEGVGADPFTLFTDASCATKQVDTMPIGPEEAACFAKSVSFVYVDANGEDACKEPAYQVMPLGAVVPAGSAYWEGAQTCEPIPDASEVVFHALGEAIDAALWTSADESLTGDGRLKARTLNLPKGANINRGFVDATSNQSCSFTTAGDGKFRCLPFGDQAFFMATGFSDDACTQPVRYAVADGTVCGQGPFIVSEFVDDAATCPARERLYSVGQKVDATTVPFFLDLGGQCTGINFADEGLEEVFEIEAELQPTVFVEGVRTTDS